MPCPRPAGGAVHHGLRATKNPDGPARQLQITFITFARICHYRPFQLSSSIVKAFTVIRNAWPAGTDSDWTSRPHRTSRTLSAGIMRNELPELAGGSSLRLRRRQAPELEMDAGGLLTDCLRTYWSGEQETLRAKQVWPLAHDPLIDTSYHAERGDSPNLPPRESSLH